MEEEFDIVTFLTKEQDGMVEYDDGKSEVRIFGFKDVYVKQIEPNTLDVICYQITYDYDTLLMRDRGHYLKHGGVGIGVWEYYNEDGELDHVVNTDEHFPITWEKMEQILKDKDISLLTADSISRYYDEEKDTATWSITIKLAWDKGCLYVFDARTGELIKEEIIDMGYEL